MGSKPRLLILNEEKYNMKTNFLKYAVCFISVLSLVACKKDGDLTFSTDPLSVDKYVNQEWTVTAQSFGVTSAKGDTLDNATWSSSDEFIVVVDAEGNAVAKHVGEAKIYAAFENGMVLYSNAFIHGRSNIINEPQVGEELTVASVTTFEKDNGKKVVRGGGDDNYVVFTENNAEYKDNTDYSVYVFGDVQGALVNIKTAQLFREYNGIFLPERYIEEEGLFVKRATDDLAVQALGEGNSLVNVGLYTTKGATDKEAVIATYRAVSQAYLDQLTDTASYNKEALGLTYDVILDVDGTPLYDGTAAEAIKTNGAAIVASSTSIAQIEDSLQSYKAQLELIYLAGAQKGAVLVCHAQLKSPYAVENYYPAAWDYIAELDQTANAAFLVTTSFKELDEAINLENGKYKRVVTKEKADTEVDKFDASFAKTYTEDKYSPENWIEVMRIHDETVQNIKDCKLETEINPVKNAGNKALREVPKL